MEASKIDKRFNAYAAISFVLTALIVGIPVWWKTTEVYRFQN